MESTLPIQNLVIPRITSLVSAGSHSPLALYGRELGKAPVLVGLRCFNHNSIESNIFLIMFCFWFVYFMAFHRVQAFSMYACRSVYKVPATREGLHPGQILIFFNLMCDSGLGRGGSGIGFCPTRIPCLLLRMAAFYMESLWKNGPYSITFQYRK